VSSSMTGASRRCAHEVSGDPCLQNGDQSACRCKGGDDGYGTHTACMSVVSVKAGDGKHYGNEGRHTCEGVYLPKGPSQSTMH
jgi:hypothetical protein